MLSTPSRIMSNYTQSCEIQKEGREWITQLCHIKRGERGVTSFFEVLFFCLCHYNT